MIREKHEMKICVRLREDRIADGEGTSDTVAFRVFKDEVITVTPEVVEYGVCRDREREEHCGEIR